MFYNEIKEKLKDDFLSYHKDHYLESIANLFVNKTNLDILFISDIFKKSKNIRNNRDRKKVLKNFYHAYKKNNCIFNLKNRDVIDYILQKDIFSPKVLSNVLKELNNDQDVFLLKKLCKFTERKFFSKKVDFFKISRNCLTKVDYKNCLPEDGLIDNSLNVIIKPVKELETVSRLANHYQCCWKIHIPSMVKGDFILLDIFDNDKGHLGTLRYTNIYKKDKWSLSGWAEPNTINNVSFKDSRYWELDLVLLKKINNSLFQKTKNEIFNEENIEMELHYNNPQKTINKFKLPKRKKLLFK